MKPRDAAVIACKALAVYALISVLNFLPMAARIIIPSVIASPPDSVWPLIFLIPPVLLIIAALVLWFCSGRIAGRMAKSTSTEPAPDPAPVNPPLLQAIIFTIIGVFIIAQALPGLLENIAWSIIGVFWKGEEPPPITFSVYRLLASLIQIGIGLALLAGAASVVRMIPRFIHWLRTAGRPTAPEQEKDTP